MSSTISIRLRLFASLREQTGIATEDLALEASTVGEARAALAARGGPWAALSDAARIRAAVNQSMASEAHPLRAGDELAFFPPVTGG